MAKCSAIRKGGAACKGIPKAGNEYCPAHDPARDEERQRYGRRDGKRAGRGRPMPELHHIKGQLQDLTDRVLAGEVERADAAVCGQLLNVKLRALETERRWKESWASSRNVWQP